MAVAAGVEDGGVGAADGYSAGREGGWWGWNDGVWCARHYAMTRGCCVFDGEIELLKKGPDNLSFLFD